MNTIKKIISILLVAILIVISLPPATAHASYQTPISSEYTYAKMVDDIENELESYGDIVSYYTGSSTTMELRNVYTILLGKGSEYIFITAGVIARETGNTPLVMQFVFDLLNAYKYNETIDAGLYSINVRSMLNEVTFVIMPLVNPDGYEYCLTYGDRDKQTNQNLVNIDRNMHTLNYVRGGEDQIGMEDFPNDSPNSEAESIAISENIKKYDFLAALDLHSSNLGRYRVIPRRDFFYGNKPKNGLTEDQLCDRVGDICEGFFSVPYFGEYFPAGSVAQYLLEYGVPTFVLNTISDDYYYFVPTTEVVADTYGEIDFPGSIFYLAEMALKYKTARYSITYLYEDGTPYKEYSVRKGLCLPYPPTVPRVDGLETYWDTDISQTKIYRNYIIRQVVVPNNHTVNYYVDGKLFYSEIVSNSKKLLYAPDVPAKTGYTNIAPRWDTNLLNRSIYCDYTVNAIYTPNQYTITFWGLDTVTSKIVHYGEPYGSMPNFVANDQLLEGWYLSRNYLPSEKIHSADIVKILKSTSLYAKIVPNNVITTVCGDVDGDNAVSSSDASMVLRYIVKLCGLNESQRETSDVDASGNVSAADASLILRYVVRLVHSFPADYLF